MLDVLQETKGSVNVLEVIYYFIIGMYIGAGLVYLYFTWPESDPEVIALEEKLDRLYNEEMDKIEERRNN